MEANPNLNEATSCEIHQREMLPQGLSQSSKSCQGVCEPEGTHNIVGENGEKPFVGMTFKTHEEARKHYERYGVSQGFSIVKRSSQSTWSHYDGVTSVLFSCSHFGSHDKKINEDVPLEKRRPNTSTMRGDCKASMRILLNAKSQLWVVRKFDDTHNHDPVSPSKTMLLKTKNKMPDAVKSMVELFSKENLPVNKVNSILGGDMLGFNDRACWNHLRDVRQKLDVGDAQWMLKYFQKRQLENPQFYHDIQCDGEGRAVNFFWVDARSRLAYQQFGDVVTFDTTYKTNKYHLPFAPFTGVNHHFETIQFGCGLLQDETEASFTWLFETWKEAMGGVAPISMITDSDPAMRAAIPKVFPDTRHRLCYWHIKMKFGEKLGHLYYKKSPFKKEMKQCLKFTYRIQDFEERWKAIMKKYGLEKNSWLTGLYDDRKEWVPVYNRITFFVGMNTTGRSEGINAFFKDYISSTTSLREFVLKYDQALKRIESRERLEDFESEQKNRLLSEKSFILKHAREIYTRNMFKKFKSMWLNVELFKIDISSNESDTYIVKFKRGTGTDHWKVKLNAETFEGTCECHYFDFVGIPCAHLQKVFARLDLDEIPEYFIKKRWLKGANKFRRNDNVQIVSQEQTDTMRFSHLCREATQWACVAYQTEKGYRIFLEGLKELGQKISEVVPANGDDEDAPFQPSANEAHEEHQPPTYEAPEDLSQILLDPNVSQTKGRNKESKVKGKENDKNKGNARYKRPIEIAKGKKWRKCNICNILQPHDSRNCPKKLKLDKQGKPMVDITPLQPDSE